MDSCLFCKIASGKLSAKIIYQDEQVTAFRDIHPVAPSHILIIPNKHIASINALEETDERIVGHMFIVAKQIAQQENIAVGGYRSIINTGSDSGQTVHHMHLHIIGGHPLRFPMG